MELTVLFLQPKFNWIPGEHRMPGGGFPLPLAAAELCTVLPPPTSYHGPFVITDRLIEVFEKLSLPEEFKGEQFWSRLNFK